jgi:hypothetical protein
VSGSGRSRVCGACSLCCTVLRVDALGKLGGTDCAHQRPEGGCGIYARRPGICRAYRCLWLGGALEEDDRPDRLGAVLDLVSEGGAVRLEIRESRRGAFDASPRLREIAEDHRRSMPVRITDTDDSLDPDRPFRVLLPDGEEQRISGDRIDVYRDGVLAERRRLPWLERGVRRLFQSARRWRIGAHARRGP